MRANAQLSMASEPNPYAPPAATIPDPPAGARPSVWVDGDAVVIHEECWLPRRCAKCGARCGKSDATPTLREFQHVPWWAHLLLGAFGALAFRRVARLPLPLCGACDERWSERRRAFQRAVLAMGAVAVVPFLLFLGAERDARGPLGLLTMLGLAGVLLGGTLLRRARLDPFIVRARLVRDRAAWLTGLHPRFIEHATRPPRERPVDAEKRSSRD